jgi:5-methyltetrahydropteroyltriglutamate--homocysteine methyltransferase
MILSNERILTTHAGSLPRSGELRALLGALAKGAAVDADEMNAAVEAATAETIDRQIKAGLDVINDGEQGRESFFTYVQHRMTGFGGRSTRKLMADRTHFKDFAERSRRQATAPDRVNLLAAPKAQAEVSYTADGRAAVAAECARFNAALADRSDYTEAFMTSASPGIIAAAMENEHYASLDDYIDAVAEALAQEYRAIVDAGLLLQIDAPDLAMERHTLFQDRPLEEFLKFVRSVIDASNRALAEIPPDRVRLHVCWGNYEGPHIFDVPLADIWSEIARSRAGALLISMANPRHAHEYRHFSDNPLPDGVALIAGVIDTTTNYVEHPEVVADRIERVASAVGDPRRVLAGTDCGFETAAGFTSVADDVVWAKLEALSEGAALASQRLFR